MRIAERSPEIHLADKAWKYASVFAQELQDPDANEVGNPHFGFSGEY